MITNTTSRNNTDAAGRIPSNNDDRSCARTSNNPSSDNHPAINWRRHSTIRVVWCTRNAANTPSVVTGHPEHPSTPPPHRQDGPQLPR